MAILGLRAMFFLLSGAASKMHYLPYGLGLILVFIGFKMLMLDVFHMPIWISLSFIVIVLTVTAILSIRHSKNITKLRCKANHKKPADAGFLFVYKLSCIRTLC